MGTRKHPSGPHAPAVHWPSKNEQSVGAPPAHAPPLHAPSSFVGELVHTPPTHWPIEHCSSKTAHSLEDVHPEAEPPAPPSPGPPPAPRSLTSLPHPSAAERHASAARPTAESTRVILLSSAKRSASASAAPGRRCECGDRVGVTTSGVGLAPTLGVAFLARIGRADDMSRVASRDRVRGRPGRRMMRVTLMLSHPSGEVLA